MTEHPTHTFPHSNIHTFDEDPLLDDLQTFWDEQDRRIRHLLTTHPDARPRGLSLRHRMPWRRHVMAAYGLLFVLNVAAALFCLFFICFDPYLPLRLTGYLLVATNACMTLHCLHRLLFLLRHPPASAATSRMSLLNRRLHMEPHYAPLPPSRRTPLIRVDFRNAVSTAFSSVRQIAAASVAAIVVLLFVSCSPVGDGYAMTAVDRGDRAAAILSVNNIIQQQ